MKKSTQLMFENQPVDVIDRFRKALEILGKDDFTYTVVNSDGTSEVTVGFPEKFTDAEEFKKMLSYHTLPYAIIEQDNMLNWLVVNSNSNYETKNDLIADDLTLPKNNGGARFICEAEVKNFDHPEFGLDRGSIAVEINGDGLIRME